MRYFAIGAALLFSIPAFAASPTPDQIIQTLGTMLSEAQNREAQARVDALVQKARAEKAEKELADARVAKP